MCERALADTLAHEDIEAYDIRVDQPPSYRRNDREERVAVIGLTSPQDMTRARSALDSLLIDGVRMHCRTYRDPRTNRLGPPSEEWRYPYVTHQSNLAHPPHPHACDIVITGLDPSTYLREAEIRELVEAECGDYTVISVRIDQKYAARAYVEMDRPSAALRAIEKLDGMIDRGHAITVNWDGRPAHPRRAPSPPRNGFTSRPFRESRLARGGSSFSAGDSAPGSHCALSQGNTATRKGVAYSCDPLVSLGTCDRASDLQMRLSSRSSAATGPGHLRLWRPVPAPVPSSSPAEPLLLVHLTVTVVVIAFLVVPADTSQAPLFRNLVNARSMLMTYWSPGPTGGVAARHAQPRSAPSPMSLLK